MEIYVYIKMVLNCLFAGLFFPWFRIAVCNLLDKKYLKYLVWSLLLLPPASAIYIGLSANCSNIIDMDGYKFVETIELGKTVYHRVWGCGYRDYFPTFLNVVLLILFTNNISRQKFSALIEKRPVKFTLVTLTYVFFTVLFLALLGVTAMGIGMSALGGSFVSHGGAILTYAIMLTLFVAIFFQVRKFLQAAYGTAKLSNFGKMFFSLFCIFILVALIPTLDIKLSRGQLSPIICGLLLVKFVFVASLCGLWKRQAFSPKQALCLNMVTIAALITYSLGFRYLLRF